MSPVLRFVRVIGHVAENVITEASTGGTDIISCANVTNSNLDFCCDHTTDCCDTGVGRFRLPDAGVALTTIAPSASTATRLPSSSSPASTTTSVTAVPAAKTPGTAPAKSKHSGISSGAKAGIAVGVVLAAVIIAALSILLWRARRKNAPHGEPVEPVSSEKPELDATNVPKAGYYAASSKFNELPSHGRE